MLCSSVNTTAKTADRQPIYLFGSEVDDMAKEKLTIVSKPSKTAAAQGSKPIRDTAAGFTPAQRYRMIAEAAYYRAERRGFQGGDPVQDWIEAEAEINRILGAKLH